MGLATRYERISLKLGSGARKTLNYNSRTGSEGTNRDEEARKFRAGHLTGAEGAAGGCPRHSPAPGYPAGAILERGDRTAAPSPLPKSPPHTRLRPPPGPRGSSGLLPAAGLPAGGGGVAAASLPPSARRAAPRSAPLSPSPAASAEPGRVGPRPPGGRARRERAEPNSRSSPRPQDSDWIRAGRAVRRRALIGREKAKARLPGAE